MRWKEWLQFHAERPQHTLVKHSWVCPQRCCSKRLNPTASAFGHPGEEVLFQDGKTGEYVSCLVLQSQRWRQLYAPSAMTCNKILSGDAWDSLAVRFWGSAAVWVRDKTIITFTLASINLGVKKIGTNKKVQKLRDRSVWYKPLCIMQVPQSCVFFLSGLWIPYLEYNILVVLSLLENKF